ncbi:MAG: hypothetical protein DI569_02090 [Sphingopyxis macrogoltabida]|uniref:Flagellar hook-length control protein-like C-terminal domain-containing protein n=1 Tax=Sphingopyxis macrogoltabida TaxID=33050 RepID=A0A2W5L490_SPHMC|nr:MAG: hypothetical protein DI569_02090 [Sphingopyxis macrogoltabida]
MMPTLPQNGASGGPAAILAALGVAGPAKADGGGFERLFAALPGTAEEPALPTGDALPPEFAVLRDGSMGGKPAAATPPMPAAAFHGAPVAPAIADTGADAGDMPAADPGPPAAIPEDAATAANLLIAAASGFAKPGTPARAAAPVVAAGAAAETSDGDPEDSDAATAPPAAPTAPVAPAAGDAAVAAPAEQAAASGAVPLPVAAGPRAASADAAPDRRAAPARSAGTIAAAPSDREAAPPGEARPATTAPAALRDAGAPMPALAAGEPKAGRPAGDNAAAMTILFAQPAAPAAAGIADSARPAPVAERMLDMTSDDAWIEQLASDIAATKSDRGDISFRLMPRHLGRLDVAMRQGDEGISLKMETQHEATATIVTAAQGRLVEDLRQQGVRVANAEVSHTPAEAGRQQQGQGRGTGAHDGDAAHLIETATERAEPRDDDRPADRADGRRNRFA